VNTGPAPRGTKAPRAGVDNRCAMPGYETYEGLGWYGAITQNVSD
jgi:hypothetical protein